MKQTKLVKILAGGTACALALSTVFAQVEGAPTSTTTTTTGSTGASSSTTTTTLNGAGVISAYAPGSDYITLRTEASADPVKYYYTKSTALVDPEGNTVEWSMLKPDMPISYTYTRQGDRMIITKVTLTKPVSFYKKETTTTTTTAP